MLQSTELKKLKKKKVKTTLNSVVFSIMGNFAKTTIDLKRFDLVKEGSEYLGIGEYFVVSDLEEGFSLPH